MEGNVVSAAKWLGSSMVLASLILVGGMRWALSSVDWPHPAESTRVPAAQAADRTVADRPPPGAAESIRIPAAPGVVPTSPGDLEELAKVFHSGEQVTDSDQAAVAELLKQSEQLRLHGKDWERFWIQDLPSEPAGIPLPPQEERVKP